MPPEQKPQPLSQANQHRHEEELRLQDDAKRASIVLPILEEFEASRDAAQEGIILKLIETPSWRVFRIMSYINALKVLRSYSLTIERAIRNANDIPSALRELHTHPQWAKVLAWRKGKADG